MPPLPYTRIVGARQRVLQRDFEGEGTDGSRGVALGILRRVVGIDDTDGLPFRDLVRLARHRQPGAAVRFEERDADLAAACYRPCNREVVPGPPAPGVVDRLRRWL